MPATEVTFDDIQRAAERIKPIAKRTPVMTSHAFNERSGINAVFKCENFQKGGAFKIRGAANFLYSIPKDELPRGVVAYSSGNHAQAVALAAKSVGAPATLVMPEDAPKSKMEATRGYGPRILDFIHPPRGIDNVAPWHRRAATPHQLPKRLLPPQHQLPKHLLPPQHLQPV